MLTRRLMRRHAPHCDREAIPPRAAFRSKLRVTRLATLLAAASGLWAAVPGVAEAGCGRAGGDWLCTISAGNQGTSPRGGGGGGQASSGPSIEVQPMCAPTGGADHCITLPETPRTSTADVAQMARDAIALPPPRPHTSPRGRTFVSLRTFLWIDRSAWRGHHAAVSVDGQTVSITGRPTHVVWDMGEATHTCQGPGTPHRGTCSYTYRRSGSHQVSATLYYAVNWTCAGACDQPSGTFGPLPSTTRLRLDVAEIQTSAR